MAERINGMSAPDFLIDIGLSAHAFIHPNGQIELGAPTHQVAWHAGKSEWLGKLGLNTYTLGIELLVEGVDEYGAFLEAINTDPNTFTIDQYDAAAWLCTHWMREYRAITIDWIVRHSDISPGRKQDPGEMFDWQQFKATINAQVSTFN